jgi:hypothetical protein
VIKLSRAGWNNVIIFSVMLFILLINVSNKKLFKTTDQATTMTEQAVLGEHAVILSLTINNKLTIERQGVNWQAKPQLISGQALDQMMLSWQQFRATQIKPIAELQTLKPNQQVKVILASNATTITQLWVYFTDDGFYVVAPATGITYLAPTPLYRQLFPFEVH